MPSQSLLNIQNSPQQSANAEDVVGACPFFLKSENTETTEFLGIIRKYFSKNKKLYIFVLKKKRDVLLNKKIFYFSHNIQT